MTASYSKEKIEVGHEQDQYVQKQKEVVVEKYKRLTRLFDLYFPHMPAPRVAIEPAGQYFYIKIQILDTMVEMAKVDHRLYPALQDILQVGTGFVEHYGVFMLRNMMSEDAETERQVGGTLTGTGYFADRQELGGIKKHVEEKKCACTKRTGTSSTVPDISANSKHERSLEKGSSVGAFYNLVKEHCISGGRCLPEYVIEKQNGVFMCRAEFLSETFTSKYAYSKEDAKEDVFQMIYEFINEKDEHCASRAAAAMPGKHQGTEELLKNRKEKAIDESPCITSGIKKRKRQKASAATVQCGSTEASNGVSNISQKNGSDHESEDDGDSDSPLFTEIRRDESSGCLSYENVHEKKMHKAHSGGKENTKENIDLHNGFIQMGTKNTFGFGDIFDSE